MDPRDILWGVLGIVSDRVVLSPGTPGKVRVPPPLPGISSQTHTTTGTPLAAWLTAAHAVSSATHHRWAVTRPMRMRLFNTILSAGWVVPCKLREKLQKRRSHCAVPLIRSGYR